MNEDIRLCLRGVLNEYKRKHHKEKKTDLAKTGLRNLE